MMLSSDKIPVVAVTASLVDWWKMAGVDYITEDAAVDWLKPVELEADSKLLSREPVRHVETARESTPAVAVLSSSDWLNDIDGLHSAIMSGLPMPGNTYGGKPALPILNLNSPLMIIGDLPDIEEIEAGILGIGAAGRLLANMVKPIGFDLRDCSLTALATTRPATGELPDTDYVNLSAFALHQIRLVDPQQILLLGSATCRALLSAELMDARISKPDVNHLVGNKAVLPTFHPRTLIARPMLKAQAWKDLQMIAKKDAL
jgi:uracil-DNA glycosylase